MKSGIIKILQKSTIVDGMGVIISRMEQKDSVDGEEDNKKKLESDARGAWTHPAIAEQWESDL